MNQKEINNLNKPKTNTEMETAIKNRDNKPSKTKQSRLRQIHSRIVQDCQRSTVVQILIGLNNKRAEK